MQQPVPPNSSLLGLQVGLYDSVMRLNMRDGVYYEGDELGNIPLKWDARQEHLGAIVDHHRGVARHRGLGGFPHMMLAVVSIEHVLANGGDLRQIAAYRGARLLYDALASQYHLIGLTAASRGDRYVVDEAGAHAQVGAHLRRRRVGERHDRDGVAGRGR